jgi:hypothetical protein
MSHFNAITSLTLALILGAVTLFSGACGQPPSPVHRIWVFKARPTPYSFGEGTFIIPPDPHPAVIQAVFNPRDKAYLGLGMSKGIKSNVTFFQIRFLQQEHRTGGRHRGTNQRFRSL